MDLTPGIPTQAPVTTANIEPKQPKKIWRIIVLAVLAILILGGGGYYVYTKYLSPKAKLANQLTSGPNLTVAKSDIYGSQFYYVNSLDTLVYQKTDKKIYADFLGAGTTDFSMLNTKNGDLVSLSPDDNHAIIYYPEESADIKNSQGNFFIVNFNKNNEMFSIGPNLSNFVWGDQNVYFMRNGLELLTYDFNMADNGPKNNDFTNPYSKITDFTQFPIAMALKPNSKLLYIISLPDTGNAFTLAAYDLSKKTFVKIMDTEAVAMSFAPSGKYLALTVPSQNITILDTSTNQSVATITDEPTAASKIIWSDDEKSITYFDAISTNVISTTASSTDRGDETDYRYHNLVKYNWETKTNTVLLDGKAKNLLSGLDFVLNGAQDKIYVLSSITNKLYQVEIK